MKKKKNIYIWYLELISYKNYAIILNNYDN